MTATLNGSPLLDVPDGGTVSGRTDEGMRSVVLTLTRDGEEVWTTRPLDIRPEPTRERSTSSTGDYAAAWWPAAGCVVVAGDAEAVAVGVADGEVRATFPLVFSGQSSLEQVGVEVVGDDLLLTSTRRVWVVDPGLTPVVRYEPEALLSGLPTLRGGVLSVPEYDFGSADELVVRTVDVPPPPSRS